MQKYIINTEQQSLIIENEDITSIELKQYNYILHNSIKKFLLTFFNKQINSHIFKIIIKTPSKVISVKYDDYNNASYKKLVYISNEDYNQLKKLFDKQINKAILYGNISKVSNNISFINKFFHICFKNRKMV